MLLNFKKPPIKTKNIRRDFLCLSLLFVLLLSSLSSCLLITSAKASLENNIPIENESNLNTTTNNTPPYEPAALMSTNNAPVITAPRVAIIEFNIFYELNGGTNPPTNPLIYNIVDLPINISDPSKDGSTFIGWTVKYDNGTTIPLPGSFVIPEYTIGNLTLTANWDPLPIYSIVYVLNGGINSPINPSAYTISNLPLSIANPSKTGFSFEGWIVELANDTLIEVSASYSIPKGITGNITLYANWSATPTYYSITYVEENLSGNPEFYTVADLPVVIVDPVKEGYDFLGWTVTFANGTSVDVPFSYSIPRGVIGNITLCANWVPLVPLSYSIIYVLEDGENAVGNPEFYTVADLPVVIVDPVKEGYDFLGWTVVFVDGNQPNLSVPPAYIIPQGTTGPVVLIATWKLTYTNTIIEEYGKVHAEFSSYYDITTGQFRRDLFNAYTIESVSEAEHIINNAGQVYSYLLVLYGRFESGSFNAGDDTTVVTVITHMLTQAIADMKATLKIDMTDYNAAYAEFNSYFNTETGQFNRDLFTEYSSESVLEAERIMNFASQIHTYLLAAYGQLDGGHFNAGDDSAVIKTATHILTQAIADMNKALKPLEAPELLVEMYDMGNRIRMWLSYPVEVEHITAVIDGKAAVFDGVLLSGAKAWMPGVGYIEAYSYIDVAKTVNWQSAVLTFMVNGQPLVYEFVNDWYMPPTELEDSGDL